MVRFHELHLRAGQSVGLLGGSFDPPHFGHLHISCEALRLFRLDRVIWLFSPGNPLKPNPPAPLNRRMAAARRLLDRHPRILLSDFEARHGTRYTAQTLSALHDMHPGVRFVWLMGADNMAQLHRWDNWQRILHSVPVGVLARPGDRIAGRTAPAARIYRHARLPASAAALLASRPPPAWCFVNVPLRSESSTDIRRRGDWQGERDDLSAS